MFLEYVALGLLIFVVLVMFYGIIVIHDIPYEIAVKRDHSHKSRMGIFDGESRSTLDQIMRHR